jgi:D-alanine-D-alanine ligase
MPKLNLAVIFGAKSAEHEVSIVTTFQAWGWIDRKKYNPFLIYIDQSNNAYLCPHLRKESYKDFIKRVLEQNKRVTFVQSGIEISGGILLKKRVKIDVALLTMHGLYGEDGKIQGMLDFFDIPYTGSGVLGSALGMDKVLMKEIFEKLGLKVVKYFWFYDVEYKKDKSLIFRKVDKELGYPVFVKPANCGSSVGIRKVKNRKMLDEAIKQAGKFDHKILIEQGISGAKDINCSILGGYDSEVSVCEEVLTDEEFLSFEEKYLKGGKTKGMLSLSRIMPAPIPDGVAKEIQRQAKMIFRELGCWGVARMDFLYQPKNKTIYPNEINTIPGSLAFYLWKASGLEPSSLIDKLVSLALERKKQQDSLNLTFKSRILDQK